MKSTIGQLVGCKGKLNIKVVPQQVGVVRLLTTDKKVETSDGGLALPGRFTDRQDWFVTASMSVWWSFTQCLCCQSKSSQSCFTQCTSLAFAVSVIAQPLKTVQLCHLTLKLTHKKLQVWQHLIGSQCQIQQLDSN